MSGNGRNSALGCGLTGAFAGSAALRDAAQGVRQTFGAPTCRLGSAAAKASSCSQAAITRINDAFVAHLQYNLDLGTQSAKEAESLSSAAEWQSAVLSGLTLVLVVGLGILIMRSVSRQLGADPAYRADAEGMERNAPIPRLIRGITGRGR